MSEQAIGVFDSGVGGLTIWQSIVNQLPNESTIYLADSANAPYGNKSKARIISLSEKNVELLIQQNVKIIVVACNTATTNAIAHLRSKYQIPFIGIEPATKPAAIKTKTGKIGILATKGTLASELFLNTSKAYRGNTEIVETVGTGLVKIVESGDLEQARPLLIEYITPMIEYGVDNIVLGCTHYPMLRPIIESIIPSEIEVIDSGAAVAKQTKKVLEALNLSSSGKSSAHKIFTNGSIEVIHRIVGKSELDVEPSIEHLHF